MAMYDLTEAAYETYRTYKPFETEYSGFVLLVKSVAALGFSVLWRLVDSSDSTSSGMPDATRAIYASSNWIALSLMELTVPIVIIQIFYVYSTFVFTIRGLCTR